MTTCCVPDCDDLTTRLVAIPLCGTHARQVYLNLMGAMESATREQLETAVGPSRGKARPGLKTQQGTVYFMRFGTLIKIGWTSNLQNRVRALGPDKVLATQPGTMQDEQALHRRFGPSWSHGEYFHQTLDLLTYIGSLE